MKKMSMIGLALSGLVLGSSGLAQADLKATHGMLVFGKNAGYISHLPMYVAPHNYQTIFKVVMTGGAFKKYQSLQADGKTLFTLVPEPFDYKELINGHIKILHADLFDGQFEQNGVKLGAVTLQIQQLIFNKKLDKLEAASDKNQYVAFGSAGEYFASHIITNAPNFDAVVTISPVQVIVHGPHHPDCKDHCLPHRWVAEFSHKQIPDSVLPLIVDGPVASSEVAAPQLNVGIGDPLTGTANIIKLIYFSMDDLTK